MNKLIIDGITIIPDVHMYDYVTRQLSWKERLFSRPWRPLQKTKQIYDPTAFVFDDQVIVSYEMFAKLQREPEMIDKIKDVYNKAVRKR